ncbi:hypothetical protein RF11_04165 [Thelohanellus kitauei]|uniref:Uncharacterized protein n=1 Tax=Thelohanellus kitauei TaxID=669202 RepID=A0A0C2JCF0_THEKT|nr:hypothetical protein RF11_04165 [Thelohanellus kitauei]
MPDDNLSGVTLLEVFAATLTYARSVADSALNPKRMASIGIRKSSLSQPAGSTGTSKQLAKGGQIPGRPLQRAEYYTDSCPRGHRPIRRQQIKIRPGSQGHRTWSSTKQIWRATGRKDGRTKTPSKLNPTKACSRHRQRLDSYAKIVATRAMSVESPGAKGSTSS